MRIERRTFHDFVQAPIKKEKRERKLKDRKDEGKRDKKKKMKEKKWSPANSKKHYNYLRYT